MTPKQIAVRTEPSVAFLGHYRRVQARSQVASRGAQDALMMRYALAPGVPAAWT